MKMNCASLWGGEPSGSGGEHGSRTPYSAGATVLTAATGISPASAFLPPGKSDAEARLFLCGALLHPPRPHAHTHRRPRREGRFTPRCSRSRRRTPNDRNPN